MADAKAVKPVTVGVIVNGSKPGAKDVLYQLTEFAQGHSNLRLLFEKRTGALIRRSGISEVELAKKSDILLVAGGDGSLIDVVDSVFPTQVPILGVNIGSLGFLTAVAETEVEKILPYMATRDLLLSPRLVLETVFHHANGKSHFVPCALNDIVIARANASRACGRRPAAASTRPSCRFVHACARGVFARVRACAKAVSAAEMWPRFASASPSPTNDEGDGASAAMRVIRPTTRVWSPLFAAAWRPETRLPSRSCSSRWS